MSVFSFSGQSRFQWECFRYSYASIKVSIFKTLRSLDTIWNFARSITRVSTHEHEHWEHCLCTEFTKKKVFALLTSAVACSASRRHGINTSGLPWRRLVEQQLLTWVVQKRSFQTIFSLLEFMCRDPGDATSSFAWSAVEASELFPSFFTLKTSVSCFWQRPDNKRNLYLVISHVFNSTFIPFCYRNYSALHWSNLKTNTASHTHINKQEKPSWDPVTLKKQQTQLVIILTRREAGESHPCKHVTDCWTVATLGSVSEAEPEKSPRTRNCFSL